MSKRRELAHHMASLSDIDELLRAMKNLALVESRRIAAFIDAQRLASGIVRDALSELLRDHGTRLMAVDTPPADGVRVLCVIGSERGFCGDLNQRLASAARTAIAASPERPAIVLVGRRLCEAWPDEAPHADAAIAGPGFAEETEAVLIALIAALAPLLTSAAHRRPLRLDLLHLAETGVRNVQVLPARPPVAPGPATAGTVTVNLAAHALYASLLGQYLETTLSTALYDALLYENEARLVHMEQACRRIDERLAELGRRANQARQEEITEEIEIILLSDQAEAADADAASSAVSSPAAPGIAA